MSEATLLSGMLKNAPEVTSLAYTDRLLICDSEGNPKRIDKQNADGVYRRANITKGSSDWVRIASLSFDASGIIKVAMRWAAVSSCMSIFSLLCHANGVRKVQCISRLSNGNSQLTKARIVYKTNVGAYLDVYVPLGANDTNPLAVTLIGCEGVSMIDFTSTNASVDSGYSADEFNLTVGGG